MEILRNYSDTHLLSLLQEKTQTNLSQLNCLCKSLETDEWDNEEKPGLYDNGRRYPKRNFPEVSYKEVDVSSDDDYIYCGECDEQYDGSCPQHGPLIFIKDKTVPLGPRFAWDSCPDYLYVHSSSIAGAGFGIWTSKDLIKGLVFGPYKGNIVYTRKEAEDSGYAWEIRRSGKVLHYIDASDTSVSNWMRFINCARCEENQNLVAFQYHGEIYYRTYKMVKADTELLVWYGNEFGDDLGIHPNAVERLKYGESKNCDNSSNEMQSSSIRTCRNFSRKLAYQRVETNSSSSLQVECKEQLLSKKFHDDISSGITLDVDIKNKTANEEKDNINSVVEGNVGASDQSKNTDIGDMKSIVHADIYLSSVNTSQTEDTCPNKDCRNSGISLDIDVKDETAAEEKDKMDFFVEENAIATGRSKHTDIGNMKIIACNRTHLSSVRTCNKFPQKPNEAYNETFCNTNTSLLQVREKKQRLSKKVKFCDRVSSGISLDIDNRGKTSVEERVKIVAGNVTVGDRSRHTNTADTKGIHKHYSLRKNIHPVHDVKFLYKCKKCDYKAMESDTVRKHMNTIHELTKRFKTQKCDFDSPKTSNLQNVDTIHERMKLYKCQKCNFASTRARNLKRHIYTVHDKIRPYMCKKCNYRASETHAIRIHVNAVHEGLKPYKCNRCDHRTSQKSNLRKHIDVVHEKKKPYKCHMCHYRTSINSDLRSHIDAVHERIKLFKCQKCDYKASKASTLRQHVVAVHDGKKLHKCEKCNFRANFLSNLRAHVNGMHEKVKLYKCQKCHFKTYWSACLRKHTIAAHGKKRHYKLGSSKKKLMQT